MNITESKLEALKYYLFFGAPELAGEPEFTYWCSDVGDFTTSVDKTIFTIEEYRKLEKGEEVYKYLKIQLEEVGCELVFSY